MLYTLVIEWAKNHAPTDLEAIFIERPVGKFPKRALDNATGVIQVAMIHGVSHFHYPVSVFELSPGTWKKEALGKGNATKLDVLDWAMHNGARHGPDEHGLEWSPTQDQADALAIARAGFSLLHPTTTEEDPSE